MTATRNEPDIHDMVRELVEPHHHRETFTREDEATGTVWEGMAHDTGQPALIDQLLLVTDSTTGSGSQAGSVASSRPALAVEAFDLVMMIDDEAARWCDRLGEDVPADTWDHEKLRSVRGSGTKARIRRVHALYPSTRVCDRTRGRASKEEGRSVWCCHRHRIDADVKRWWQQARIVSGFDSSAVYRLHNTCPVCEVRKGLRVNVETRMGLCTECWSVWAGADWDRLVMHIRIENTPDDTDDNTQPNGDPA